MFNNNKILVVIPARKGSKGIPRKNIRLLNNRPLISYSIEIARASEYVDDIVVTTDDSEIALISEKFGASVIRRGEELSGDEIPLDPVIYDAMIQKEKLTLDEYDIIITLQPTSPLIKTSTLNRAIELFDDFSIDSVISVVDDRHLTWGYDDENQRYFPNYIKRVNRQYLPKSFKETGAILATRRKKKKKDSRLGTNAIVVNAYDEIGTGHVFRCLAIASKLVFHDVLFIMNEEHQLGVDIVKDYNYPIRLYNGEKDIINSLREFSPNIVINDILDTTKEYVSTLKNEGFFIVNFEDLGFGTLYADVVFDALYEHDVNQDNIFTGHKYYILKDEFYFQPPKIITPAVNNVLITFGGTDPNNFTELVLNSILSTNYEGRINVVLGLGYKGIGELIEKYKSKQSIQFYQNVSNISDFMFKADIIFTSAGRTMYEICSLGVPTICLCQNERELTHVFGNPNNGFKNMGLGKNLTKKQIIDGFIELVNNYDLRVDMNRRMLAIDLKDGFENISSIIHEKYRKFKLNR